MADITANLSPLKRLHIPAEVKWTSAANSTADGADVFTFTLTAGGADLLLLIDNTAASSVTGAGSVTYSFAAGLLGCPPAVNDPAVNLVVSGKMAALRVDSAFVQNGSKELVLTVTPPSGGNLAACGLRVAAVETNLSDRSA